MMDDKTLDAKLGKGIRLQKCIAMDGDYGGEKSMGMRTMPDRPHRMPDGSMMAGKMMPGSMKGSGY